MVTITDITNNMVNLLDVDREYTLFIQYDNEMKEVYFELTDEFEKMIVDGTYDANYLEPILGIFTFDYDWEARIKIVKPKREVVNTRCD